MYVVPFSVTGAVTDLTCLVHVHVSYPCVVTKLNVISLAEDIIVACEYTVSGVYNLLIFCV